MRRFRECRQNMRNQNLFFEVFVYSMKPGVDLSLDFVPESVRKKISATDFVRKNIPALKQICNKLSAEIYLPKKVAAEFRYKLYVKHLYFTINTLYLNFGHHLEQKIECKNSALPKIDIVLYHIDVPKVFKLGEKFPFVNGGYTQFGKNNEFQIVVFRAEEMDRVVIHEMVHVFEFDIPLGSGQRKLPAPYLSCNNAAININEAITDFAAVVIVTRISRYYNYTHERIWSYIQAARVTKLLGFKSVDEIWKSPNCIEEKTSLIAYYVIKSALLHTYRTRGYRKLLKVRSFDETEDKPGFFDKYRLLTDKNSIADLLQFITKFRRGENKNPDRDIDFGRLKGVIDKLRTKKEERKEYNFANLIGAAVLDPEWQRLVNEQILHPQLFSKSGTASAKMSITETIRQSDLDSKNFYTETIYTL